MAEALKTFFSPAIVERMAGDIARIMPSFRTKAFIKQACTGLDDMELLERGKHIAVALGDFLPDEYPDAIEVLLRSLGPPHATDELVGAGMEPFFYLPHVLFVAEWGLDHFDLSMRAQYELTKRFSAESSIRAYIAKDPERVFAYLKEWTKDKDPHVRRLVSEGTRLRLPWAARVPWLDQHPDRVVALLDLLKDDPATLVRRSVANNLNDLGKVHPDVLFRACGAWLEGATPERRALVEHALRSSVKRGEKGALALIGYGKKPNVSVENVKTAPLKPKIGGKLTLSFSLRNKGKNAQDLLVDVAVHYVKSTGKTSPKVFKLKRVTLQPGETAAFEHKVSLADMSTRTHYPGIHPLEVIVNGAALPLGQFVLAE